MTHRRSQRLLALSIVSILVALPGCSKLDEYRMEREFIQLTRCYIVGDLAGPGTPLEGKLDSVLVNDAVRHQWSKLSDKGYPVNPLTLSSANSAVRREFSGESGSGVAKLVLKWYASDYCQDTISAYQDDTYGDASKGSARGKARTDDALVHRKAMHLAQSQYDEQAGDARCSSYREQFEALSSRSALRSYREDLLSGVRKTLADSTQSMEPRRQEALQALIAKEQEASKDGLGFHARIAQSCRKGVGDTVRNVKEIMYAPSPRTAELQAIRATLQGRERACGDFERLYCRSELFRTTVDTTLAKSRECDAGTNEGCPHAGGLHWLQLEFRTNELATLMARKTQLEKYIAAPQEYSRNMQYAIDAHRLPCEQAAMRAGMKGQNVLDHVKQVCIPEAVEAFVRPQREEVARIEAAMQELQPSPTQ